MIPITLCKKFSCLAVKHLLRVLKSSTKTEHNQDPLLDTSASFMEETVVTKKVVTKLLKGPSPSQALRHDELPPSVLKTLVT